ncbi:MAG: T9SS type A sorting domain-containing protein [Bacteroidaceae bacterium]|nr:T9SS type A sorting domain-containing protein [Bacteroidaceae bacterium]
MSIYDLSGRQINSIPSTDSKLSTINSQRKSGIYIVNGKKVIIK